MALTPSSPPPIALRCYCGGHVIQPSGLVRDVELVVAAGEHDMVTAYEYDVAFRI